MSIKDLDDIDKNIIQLLENDPLMTRSAIAKKLDRSQPAIGARIKKLRKSNLLKTQIGLDFKNIEDLNLVMVHINTKNPEALIEMGRVCPYVLNSFKTSGTNNIIMLMASSSLKRLDAVIDRHFRTNPDVEKVSMDLVVEIADKLILPIDLTAEKHMHDKEDPCSLYPLCFNQSKNCKTFDVSEFIPEGSVKPAGRD